MTLSLLSRLSLAGALIGVALPGSLAGQEAQPDWDLRFRSEARVDDNPDLDDVSPGTGHFLINTLGLRNRLNTRVSEFALDVSGELRFQDTPTDTDDVDFDDPRLTLSYDRAVGDDAIGLFATLRSQDVGFVDALDEVGNLNDLDFDDVRGGGQRQSGAARVDGVINGDAPITFEYLLEGSFRRYIDNDEPDLTDLTQYLAEASVLFDVTPTARAVLDLGYDYRDEDDEEQTLRQRARITTGVNLLLDDVTALNLRLGYSEVRTEEQTFGTEETETGVIGSIAWRRDLQDGDVNLIYSVELDENGQRDRLLAGRNFERGTTTFGGDIGISARELTDEIRPIGSLFVTQDLPRARLAASLEQDVGVDEDSEDTVFTRLNLTYEQDFTSDLSFVLNLAAGRRFDEVNDNQERRRLNVSASLRNELARNWNLDVGYRYRYREGNDASIATSNAVFAALVRDFQIN